LDEGADIRGELALDRCLSRRPGFHGRRRSRDDTRRRVADAQETTFSLAHDLEANRALVQIGTTSLELAQRRPLRFADGLARRLDDELVVQRLAPFFFFFRRTTRGCPVGFGAAGAGFAPSSASSSRSFGGVLDVRLGRATGFGASRRVTRPWPTVQRFVVIQ